jgi:hypothetical protein
MQRSYQRPVSGHHRGTNFSPCLSRRLAWPFLAVIIPRDVLTYTWPVVHGKVPLVVALFYASSGALTGLLLAPTCATSEANGYGDHLCALNDSPISGVTPRWAGTVHHRLHLHRHLLCFRRRTRGQRRVLQKHTLGFITYCIL